VRGRGEGRAKGWDKVKEKMEKVSQNISKYRSRLVQPWRELSEGGHGWGDHVYDYNTGALWSHLQEAERSY